MACLANLCQAALATGQGRLAAAGEWALNEKRLTERAGLDAIQDRLAQPGPDLGALVSDVRARLELSDDVWAGGSSAGLSHGPRGRHLGWRRPWGQMPLSEFLERSAMEFLVPEDADDLTRLLAIFGRPNTGSA